MKNKKIIKNILIGLVIALLLLVAYAVVNGKTKTSESTSSSLSSLKNIGSLGQVQQTDTALQNAEILKILGNIQGIELKDDIFLNPVFRTLVDSRFTIPKPLKIGRPNPFLPIGFDAIVESNNSGQIDNQGGQIDSGDGDIFNQNPTPTEDASGTAETPLVQDSQSSDASNFFGDFANSDTQQ